MLTLNIVNAAVILVRAAAEAVKFHTGMEASKSEVYLCLTLGLFDDIIHDALDWNVVDFEIECANHDEWLASDDLAACW